MKKKPWRPERERLELCKKIKAEGDKILAAGHNFKFVPDKEPTRERNRSTDRYLCQEIIIYSNLLVNNGINPKLTCSDEYALKKSETDYKYKSRKRLIEEATVEKN